MINRNSIKHSFGKAAATYDEWADVQKQVGEQTLSMLPERHFTAILEIGCGTGSFTSKLTELTTFDYMVSTDISHEMVVTARKKNKDCENLSFFTSDAGYLNRLITSDFDLVISNSSLHWLNNFPAVMESLFKLVSNEGVFMASIFNNESLTQLIHVLEIYSLSEVKVPVSFFPSNSLIESLMSTLYDKCEFKKITIEKKYPDFLSLLRSLARTGVSPPSKDSRPLIRSPLEVKKIEEIFYNTYGSVKVSYNIALCKGIKF